MRIFNLSGKNHRFIGMSFLSRILGYLIFTLAKINPFFSEKFQLAGDVSNYSDWLRKEFNNPKRFYNRERLFNFLIKKHLQGETIVLEFGVAKGYLTEWFLARDSNKSINAWHGFDTFEGLPSAWRNYEIGAFSNQGEVPSINDERIVWHVGFAEIKIKSLDTQIFRNRRLLVIFDLDLAAPTKEILSYLYATIKPGDLIYFDEAFDIGERSYYKLCVTKIRR